MKKAFVAAVGGIGGVLLVISVILGWYGFPAIVQHQIEEGVSLRTGSQAYERWQKLPQPMHFKVHLWNVTNPEAVSRGEKPILRDVGPYHYDEYLEKTNIEDHPKDETISYRERRTFYFNQEKSGNLSENDVLTVLNMPLLGLALTVKRSLPFALPMMDKVLEEIFPNSSTIFLTATIRDLLFNGVVFINCTDPTSSSAILVCSQIEDRLPVVVRKVPGVPIFKFSLFHHKNATETQSFRVSRGLSASHDLGRIREWNGKKHLKIWSNDSCNMINGTDATVFPPMLTQKDRIYIFAPDLCRSLYAEYEKDIDLEGVPALHFVSTQNLLKSGNNYPENKCFCNEKCLYDGVLDISKCLDADLIVSHPHMYLVDHRYLNFSEGMSPQKDDHQTFVDLEPKTGTPLRGAKRIQFNMFLTQIKELQALQNVSMGLFPIMWCDEGIELSKEFLGQVQDVYTKLGTLDAVKWTLLVASIIILLIAATLYIIMRRLLCGRHLSKSISFSTTPLGPKNVSITTIDGILHRDQTIPVQTFSPPIDDTLKSSK